MSRSRAAGPQIRAKKSLGQNFLRDSGVIAEMLARLPADPLDVLEIGAGPGTMTVPMAESGRRVTAVEIDADLLPVLARRTAGMAVSIAPGDALELDLAALVQAPYAVVGNIPYYITGALIPRLLQLEPGAEWIALMVQLEVAERLCADPGGWSLATLAARAYADVEMLMRVPAHAFDPVPGVDSAVVLLRPHDRPVFVGDGFFDFARAVFQERRKKLSNGVANALGHDQARGRQVAAAAGLDEMRRPQTLDLEEWGRLYAAFREVEQG